MSFEPGDDLINVQLLATVAFADGGAGPSRIRFYATEQPERDGAAGGPHIVEIELAKPCATVVGTTMTLHPASPTGGMVMVSGVPLWGRWTRSDDKLVTDGKAVDMDPAHVGDWRLEGGVTADGNESPTLQAGGLVLLGELTFG